MEGESGFEWVSLSWVVFDHEGDSGIEPNLILFLRSAASPLE
jgi:hypothetical protein